MSHRQLAAKTWQAINDDDVLGRAGQLAYFFFFAIFPLGIFLTALLGVFVGPGSPLAQNLAEYITRAMPSSAAGLVHQTLQTDLANSGGGKLTFGIVIALLSASSGTAAMMDTLNVVFGVKEGRSILKQRTTAALLTIAMGILICIAIALIVVGGNLANVLAGGALKWLWQIVQYPVAVFFLFLSYSVIYYYAPNVEHPKWHWVTPGATFGVCLWILISFALRVYLHFYSGYTASYGSLGAVMILLLWFYITGLAILIGGEINAAIERAGTGQTKQQEPPQSVPAGKIEAEKAERQAEQEVDPKRVA
ncbi:MAG TPA: YihY/virulence factor BrkB family protein [Terriglobales bacterium]|nr:YihY/virulence factor BrkB family protein [Terriglobales bacterium]